LAPVQGRRSSEAGKVTVGLATHWTIYVTDFVVYPRTQVPRKADKTDEQPAYAHYWARPTFTFLEHWPVPSASYLQ